VIIYHPINTGALPAIIPKNVHEIVFRHIAEAKIPIRPIIKHAIQDINVTTSPSIISTMDKQALFQQVLSCVTAILYYRYVHPGINATV